MKRAVSENNSENDGSQNDGGNNANSGSGNNNNNRGGQKRFRSNEESIRLLIPSRFAGGIIGKGGSNIKRLRQEFNANINVEDCPGPERTVNISAAELNNALKVVEDILRNFGEQPDSEIDLRLLIHQSLAGCVIGKGGGKIKEIRDKVGCRILKVFLNMCPQSSDRVVQCIGKVNECMDAIGDILILVKEVPIKGPIQNYDPINYDDYMADKYGGFGGDNAGNSGNRNNQRGGGGGGGRNNNRDNRDNRGGDNRNFERRDNNNRNFNNRRGGNDRGGNNNRGGDRDRNSFISPWASNPMENSSFDQQSFSNNGFNSSGGGGFGGSNLFGNSGLGGFNNSNSLMGNTGLNNGFGNNPNMNNNSGFDNNLGNNAAFGLGNNLGSGNNLGNNLGNNMGNNNQNDEAKETTQVTIPKDLAGAIIGKAGARIRRIRMDSNAFITIDEPAQGSTDRIITISDTQRQIQLAQYLLQQSVREHRRN